MTRPRCCTSTPLSRWGERALLSSLSLLSCCSHSDTQSCSDLICSALLCSCILPTRRPPCAHLANMMHAHRKCTPSFRTHTHTHFSCPGQVDATARVMAEREVQSTNVALAMEQQRMKALVQRQHQLIACLGKVRGRQGRTPSLSLTSPLEPYLIPPAGASWFLSQGALLMNH
jgi:hypothetical protein